MNQKDKELLLQDLCARLPYNVMVDYESHIYILNEIDPACKDIDYITVRIQDVKRLMCAKNVMIDDIKPYLRPMSSMTLEEYRDWIKYSKADYDCEFQPEPTLSLKDCHLSVDWLNAHHFDYRDLIPKGLAIEVTKENNPYASN